jgi:hypothetical protein
MYKNKPFFVFVQAHMMFGHLIFQLATFNIEALHYFSHATLLILLDQMPQSINLEVGIDQKTCLDLERNFMLGWLSKWANLSQLQRSFKDALDTIYDLSTKQIDEELAWTSIFFVMKQYTSMSIFLGGIIYNYLFASRKEIGLALQT